ncbi:MAG: hypothetical protein AAF564_20900 [Bacteroidota bacterium]
MSRDVIILASIGVYLFVCIVIGIWALRRTNSSSEFFMAGRSLGVFLTAFAVFSSTMSGFGFVGGPGLVYSMGTSSFWIICSGSLGYLLAFTVLSKKLRLIGELRDCVSLPDVVAARYNSNSVRAWIAVAIILGVMGYLATQILAMSIVLKDILNQSGFFGEMSLEQCMAISCAVLVFYSVTGGIVASVYTDLIQGAIMIVAAMLVFLTVLFTFDGGFTEMSGIIKADDAAAIGPWGTMGMIGCISWMFVFSVGALGQPHVMTKIMMNKKVSDAKHILPMSIFGYLTTALLWIGIGLVMRALVLSGGHPVLSSPDEAASQFLQNYAHPLLAGIVFAGLFAAIMSTADGFLNIGTAAIVHDLPKAIKGKLLKNELGWARIVTVILAVVASVFALYTGDLVALLGAFGWGTFAAAIVPVVAFGLNWKRATALAANVAVISSLVINFTVKVGKISMPYNIDVGAFALIVSLTLFISISMLSTPKEIDPDVEAVMDL